jgi:hypothetical protein
MNGREVDAAKARLTVPDDDHLTLLTTNMPKVSLVMFRLLKTVTDILCNEFVLTTRPYIRTVSEVCLSSLIFTKTVLKGSVNSRLPILFWLDSQM